MAHSIVPLSVYQVKKCSKITFGFRVKGLLNERLPPAKTSGLFQSVSEAGRAERDSQWLKGSLYVDRKNGRLKREMFRPLQ